MGVQNENVYVGRERRGKGGGGGGTHTEEGKLCSSSAISQRMSIIVVYLQTTYIDIRNRVKSRRPTSKCYVSYRYCHHPKEKGA